MWWVLVGLAVVAQALALYLAYDLGVRDMTRELNVRGTGGQGYGHWPIMVVGAAAIGLAAAA